MRVKFTTIFLAVFLLLAAPQAHAGSAFDLSDAITGLKFLSGAEPENKELLKWDINDNKFGLEEVAFILQYITGLRQFNEVEGVTVSGFVKNITNADQPGISNASVEIKADLNNDGAFSAGEVFIGQSDTNGFFAVTIPRTQSIAKITLHARCAGYSEFIKKYENVKDSFSLQVGLSEGSFNEIDIAGISASPTRSDPKYVTLESDDQIRIDLFRNSATGQRTSRTVRSGEPVNDSENNGNVLVSTSFSLRGIRAPANSEKIYASVAYLDTVNDPDTMPGDFITEAEGDGETPRDLLKTYGASIIKLYDQNGKELMTDPTDRSSPVSIKIAIAPEAYDTLEDMKTDTPEKIEIPLYFYDEHEEIWKLHKNEDGSPAYGILQDNFGNVLTQQDLALLQDVTIINGTIQTRYQPAGAASSEITIYTVGTVYHFSAINCDQAGRIISVNSDIIGSDGKPMNNMVRTKKIVGGYGSDYDRRTGSSRRHVHVYRPDQIDNAVRKLLSGDKVHRDYWLRWVLEHKDPNLIQAMSEGIRRYAIGKREEWLDEDDDLARGIKAIFSNKLITDAIINTTDIDAGGLDCSKAPDLCKGIIAQAAEQVTKSGDAKKAVAFLMEIAVDAYNPGKLDFEYAVEKGLGMMELVVSTGDAKSKLGSIPSLLLQAKSYKDTLESFGWLKNPPSPSSADWNDYWDLCYNMKESISKMKSEATRLGSKLKRSVPRADAVAPPPGNEADLEKIRNEMVWDYEDLGGFLLGANRFSRFKWGYYKGDNFIETNPPPGLIGGSEISVLEFFNGREWAPLQGRSSTGIDAGFIPVPNQLSFGNGSPNQPVVYLGKWIIDVTPNVTVTGRLVNADGQPLTNASDLPLIIGDAALYADDQGNIRGMLTLFEETVTVTIPSAYSGKFKVSDNQLVLGDIKLADQIIFTGLKSASYTTTRNEPFTVDTGARTLSGKNVTFSFELFRGYYWYNNATPILEIPKDIAGKFTVSGFDDVGYHTLRVNAASEDGTLTKSQNALIQVLNSAPVINDILITPANNLSVGNKFTVSLDVSDQDGIEDIRYQRIYAYCMTDGNFYLGTVQGQDDQGKITWEINTDYNRLYQVPSDTITGKIIASVTDKAGGYATFEKEFTLNQTQIAPTVSRNYVSQNYVVSYPLRIYPHYVHFHDQNNDIVSYRLDCDKGGSPVEQSEPIHQTDLDPLTEGDQFYCEYTDYRETPYRFSYKAVDSKGNEAEAVSQIIVLGPVDIGFIYPGTLTVIKPEGILPDGNPNQTGSDVVLLPSGADRSFQFALAAATPNGDKTLASFDYSVRYEPRPEYAYYWQSIASGNLDQTLGTGNAVVEISKPGKYYVFVNVKDNADMYASFSKMFYVTADFDYRFKVNDQAEENLAAYYLTGDTLTFASELTEPVEGFSGSYQWEIRYDGATDFTAKGASAQFQETFTIAGTHTVRLTLANTADPTHPPITRDMKVTIFQPLTASIAADYSKPPEPGFVALGDPYPLQVTVPDGITVVKAYWRITKADLTSADNACQIISSAGLLGRTFRFVQEGSYTVSVYLEDDRGLTANVAADVIQVKAYPPVIDSLTTDTSSGPPPLTVNLTAAAHDPDGQVVNYIWTVTGQSIPVNGQVFPLNETFVRNSAVSATPEKFSYTFDKEGDYEIALVAEDNSLRKSAKQSESIRVAFQNPVIESLKADPSGGEAPLKTTMTVTASDPDGEIATIAWDVSDDGVFEQSGASAVFTHTFETVGNYPVKVTVTNTQGKQASKTVTIYVVEPGQGVILNFREIRANGLGNPIDFAAMANDPYGEEMFGKFVKTGADNINVNPEQAQALETPMTGILGFNGFYNTAGGSPQIYLAGFSAAGAYDVGISPVMQSGQIAMSFPVQYTCASTVFGNYVQQYGTSLPLETPGQVPLSPASENVTTDGVINVLALLGNEVVDNFCKPTYVGFVSGAGPFTLTDLTRIPTVPLEIPAGYSFNDLVIYVNGSTLQFYYSINALQKDPNGNYLIPVIPNATYEFEFKKDQTDYTFKAPVAEISGVSAVKPDFTVFGQAEIALSNMPEGGNLVLTWTNDRYSAETLRSNLTGTETGISNVPVLNGASSVEVSFFGSNAASVYKKFLGTGFSNSVDFSKLTGSVNNLQIAVDQTAKTCTVSYNSVAPMTLIQVNFSYAEYRSQEFSYISDPSKTSFAVSYPIPEITLDHHGTTEVRPATDAVESVHVTVYAMQPATGYNDTLRHVFENLKYTNWSLDNFKQSRRVDEIVSASANWQKPAGK